MTKIEQPKEQFLNDIILMMFTADGKAVGESDEANLKKAVYKYHNEPLFNHEVKIIFHFANQHAAKALRDCRERLTGFLLTDSQMMQKAIDSIEK